jgi:septal ring factor EnvC (AmiA/AmiB activator)
MMPEDGCGDKAPHCGPAPNQEPDPGCAQEKLRARDLALAELAARLAAAEAARDGLTRTVDRQAREIVQLSARLLGAEPDRAELQARLEIMQAALQAERRGLLRRLVGALGRRLRRPSPP